MGERTFDDRSMTVKMLLRGLTESGPVSWDAIKAAALASDLKFETLQRAIREGCSYGVFIKTGGAYHEGSGPAMVTLTNLGRQYFDDLILKQVEAAGEIYTESEPCTSCGNTPTRVHVKYGAQCVECDLVPDEDQA